MASCGMNTYSESRIELQNLQMLKKMLEKSTQFLTSAENKENNFMFHSWHQSVWKTILRLRKVEFFKSINITNTLFIGFVKFEA